MDFSAPTSTASDDHAEVKCAPPPPLRPPKSRKTIIVSDDEDEDEYKESDTEDDDDDDDDYAPSLGVASKSRKRGRAPHRRSTGKGKKKAVYSSAASSRAPSSRLSPAAEPPFKRRRLVPESRNLQFISPELQRALANTSSENCNFTCPVCGWKQVNKRMPDFHRHLKTHARPDPNDKTEGYWCKGARVENLTSFNAKQRAENDKTIPLDAKPYLFHDHMRVGGCCQQFSRRDALKRHMMNANVTCAGPIGKGLDE
ncbi:hypothetical protein GYMLUDRAFT_173192 [Collybiopsis luxurians FD-317 M1]|uniref:Uncharacterized protein n=1 Tax=Collybiopsis luxurians FD-317 M1 TaxID=944289 RepID=A0A0D0BQ16_9AGAR|nr:hypothetical protein GYMLUDRAFT_173192 [Collybiopsis luxurians FD-317 M1]